MIDPNLKAMADGPLANPLRLNVPMGRRAAPRSAKAVYEGTIGDTPLTEGEAIKRREDSATAKMKAVLDYYATTTVPFDRIAEHTNIPLNRVAECMKERGRLS